MTSVCYAQKQEDLHFLDIPIGGSLDDFCSKLVKEKGLVNSIMTEGEQYYQMETRKLTGEYFGIKNCNFYVRKSDRLDYVTSVIVEDSISTLEEKNAKGFISKHDEKFGKHQIDTISVDSLWYLVKYTWKTANGNVELNLKNKGFSVFYTNNIEDKIREEMAMEFRLKRERETVREICGIPFGTSYEEAAELLENKYGRPSYFSDRTRISYSNKTYAGILFDNIHFLFQSDGYKSYMNGCVFVLEASSLKKAEEKRDFLYYKLLSKYEMREGADDDGIKLYYGGHSPIPFGGFGFTIDIIKYDNNISVPYAARLMYGRYNYVTEEF